MAICIYTGAESVVQSVIYFTPGGTIEVGDLFRIAKGAALLEVAATGATVALTCADIYAALIADSCPLELQNYTYALDDDVTPTMVIATGPADGRDDYSAITVTTVEAGGGAADAQTFTKTQHTVGVSPHDYSLTGNWSGGALPGTGDTAVFGLYDYCPKYNIAVSGTDVAEVQVWSSGTSGLQIGLPTIDPTYGFTEFLNGSYQIQTAKLTYGLGNGAYVPALNIDTGSAGLCATRVLKTNGRDSNGDALLQYTGAHASNTMEVISGSVDIAMQPGWSGQLVATCTVGPNADIRAGKGVTITTLLTQEGNGRAEINCGTAPTTVRTRGAGVLTMNGDSGTVTTLDHTGTGQIVWNRAGTITNADIAGPFTLGRAVTFTNAVKLYAGADYRDPNRLGTYSGGLDLKQQKLPGNGDSVKIDLGQNIKITPADVS